MERIIKKHKIFIQTISWADFVTEKNPPPTKVQDETSFIWGSTEQSRLLSRHWSPDNRSTFGF
jgi:hypothetical protein